MAYEEAERVLATGSSDAVVKVWDLRASTEQPILNFSQHRDIIKDVAISPDGRWVASGSADGSLKIWELSTGRMVHELAQHAPNSRHQVTCVEYNPQTLTLAAGSTDKKVRYWDLENFQLISQTTNDSTEI